MTQCVNVLCNHTLAGYCYMQQQVIIDKFTSKGGKQLFVRQIGVNDAHLLVDLFAHMSAESRYQRFLQTVDHISEERMWEEATQIAEQSAAGDSCLGGFVVDSLGRETLVGAARYVRLADNSAEFALSIRDDHQNQGIGTGLLRLLLREARQNGVETLVATVHNDNERMLHLLHALERPLDRTVEEGSSFFTLRL